MSGGRRESEWVGIGSVARSAKTRTLERDAQSEICDALAALPVRVERMHSGRKQVNGTWMKLHPPGTPDLMVMLYGGRVCYIECKRDEREGLSKDQERVHKEYEAMGHIVAVCWTGEQAVRFVNEQRRKACL